MTEFIIVFGLAFFMILGIIQFAIVYNAQSMLQLATFTAARAAITSREDKRADPVTLDTMRANAQLAACITIMPAMPWLQGRLSGVTPFKIQTMFAALSATPKNRFTRLAALEIALNLVGGQFKNQSKRIAAECYGFTLPFGSSSLQVKFFKADHKFFPFIDPMNLPEDAISDMQFDDREKSDDNLIKVVTKWNFPLMIPFVDRVLYVASGQAFSEQGVIKAAETPAWAVGTGLYAGRSEPFRIPLYGTSVMRMQWDRKS